jgi:hypothetical protein
MVNPALWWGFREPPGSALKSRDSRDLPRIAPLPPLGEQFSITMIVVKLQNNHISKITSVRLKREQIQLVALDAVVGFVFDSGNHLTEQHFFEERH